MSERPALRSGRTQTRVRYPEADRMGIAHHTHHLTWFELGRTELMREAGCPYGRLEDDDGVFFPVIEACARYRAPARYDDELTISTRLVEVTGVKVRFEYEVERAHTRERISSGFTVHASVGRDGRPTRLPAALRSRLTGDR
jgi:acyl-CoA thioester hydrolase